MEIGFTSTPVHLSPGIGFSFTGSTQHPLKTEKDDLFIISFHFPILPFSRQEKQIFALFYLFDTFFHPIFHCKKIYFFPIFQFQFFYTAISIYRTYYFPKHLL